MTHYATLGVSENASIDEIKKAYRKLANQHHPDKGGDTTQFQKIQAAYDAIGDEQRRAQYDAERRGMGGFRFTVNGQDIDSGMPQEMEDMLRNFGFGFSFGPGFASHGGDPFSPFRQSRRNKDIQVDLTISLASTLEPQVKTISVQNTNGERYSVDVNIPRGVRPNSSIKYPKLGDNFFNTLERGDLYVRINVEGSPEFQVDNLDLIKRIDLNSLSAIVGTEIEVSGLDNKKFNLTIPPGTQHGTKLRLINQGLYTMNQSGRGSLIIVINLITPTDLTTDQINSLKNTFNL